MKVAIIGQTTIDNRQSEVWSALRGVLRSLSPTDTVIHTGRSDTLGAMIDSIKAHAKGEERRRLPRIEVQVPEIGRYSREEAMRQNALQIMHVRQPDVVVYVGGALNEDMSIIPDQSGDEMAHILEFAELYPRTRVLAADTFIEERAG